MTLAAVAFSLVNVSRAYPMATLIFATVIAIAVAAIVLYIGELVIIGWVVDFLSQIGMPKFHPRSAPLECEQVGEVLVVNLRDNIATTSQCKAVEKQLRHFIDAEHYCDFVLDFVQAGNVSKSFRAVMISLTKAARREAEKRGKRFLGVDLPRGETFAVFDDRQHALEAMSGHAGHGWVVLCSVPVGIRAVSELE